MSKKIIFLFFIIIFLLILTGCGKKEEEIKEVEEEPKEMSQKVMEMIVNESHERAREDIKIQERLAERDLPKKAVMATRTAGEYCLKIDTEKKLTLAKAQEIAGQSECGEKGQLTGDYFCNNVIGAWWLGLDIKNEIWEKIKTKKETCSPACVVNIADSQASINWRCTGVTLGPYTMDIITVKNDRKNLDFQDVRLEGYCAYLASLNQDNEKDFRLYQYQSIDQEGNDYLHLKGISDCLVGEKYVAEGVLEIFYEHPEADLINVRNLQLVK